VENPIVKIIDAATGAIFVTNILVRIAVKATAIVLNVIVVGAAIGVL
jgi:hypothetical protein